MDKHEFLEAIAELILNNSDIEAEEDDEILVSGVEDVMENVGPNGTEDVTVLFTDGRTLKLTVQES